MASLQDIVDLLAARTGRAIDVEDRRFRLLAHSAHEGPVDAVRRDTILRRAASPPVVERLERLGVTAAREPLRLPAAPELGMGARLCFPVRERDQLLGFVWVLDDPAVPDAELTRLGDELRPVGAALAALRDAEDDRARAGAEALAAAIAGDAAPATALLAEAGPILIVVADADLSALRGRAGTDRALLGIHQGRAVALLAGDAAGTGTADVPGPAGVGGPLRSLADTPEALRQATLAHHVARTVPRFGPVAHFAALGPHALLAPLALAGTPPPRALATLAAAPDGAELLLALRAVLDAGDDVRGAAAALHVHRSTLHRRLRRVEQLTGLDLADGAARLELHAGLVLQELSCDPGRTQAP